MIKEGLFLSFQDNPSNNQIFLDFYRQTIRSSRDLEKESRQTTVRCQPELDYTIENIFLETLIFK